MADGYMTPEQQQEQDVVAKLLRYQQQRLAAPQSPLADAAMGVMPQQPPMMQQPSPLAAAAMPQQQQPPGMSLDMMGDMFAAGAGGGGLGAIASAAGPKAAMGLTTTPRQPEYSQVWDSAAKAYQMQPTGGPQLPPGGTSAYEGQYTAPPRQGPTEQQQWLASRPDMTDPANQFRFMTAGGDYPHQQGVAIRAQALENAAKERAVTSGSERYSPDAKKMSLLRMGIDAGVPVGNLTDWVNEQMTGLPSTLPSGGSPRSITPQLTPQKIQESVFAKPAPTAPPNWDQLQSAINTGGQDLITGGGLTNIAKEFIRMHPDRIGELEEMATQPARAAFDLNPFGGSSRDQVRKLEADAIRRRATLVPLLEEIRRLAGR